MGCWVGFNMSSDSLRDVICILRVHFLKRQRPKLRSHVQISFDAFLDRLTHVEMSSMPLVAFIAHVETYFSQMKAAMIIGDRPMMDIDFLI